MLLTCPCFNSSYCLWTCLVSVCHFCGVRGHIRPNCHKLKLKHSVCQSRIRDDIAPAISPYKLFHMLLKNLSLLACERNLQDFSLSQKKIGRASCRERVCQYV